MTESSQALLRQCISIDLEVDPATATIFASAAVHDDARPPILARKRVLFAAMDLLEARSADAGHVLDRRRLFLEPLPHRIEQIRTGNRRAFNPWMEELSRYSEANWTYCSTSPTATTMLPWRKGPMAETKRRQT